MKILLSNYDPTRHGTTFESNGYYIDGKQFYYGQRTGSDSYYKTNVVSTDILFFLYLNKEDVCLNYSDNRVKNLPEGRSLYDPDLLYLLITEKIKNNEFYALYSNLDYIMIYNEDFENIQKLLGKK